MSAAEIPEENIAAIAKRISTSEKCQLQFPVTRIKAMLQAGFRTNTVTDCAAIFMTAVLEYLTQELLDVSIHAAISDRRTRRIQPKDINAAIWNDPEFRERFRSVTISMAAKNRCDVMPGLVRMGSAACSLQNGANFNLTSIRSSLSALPGIRGPRLKRKAAGVKVSSSLKPTAMINAKAGGVKESSSLKSTAIINAKAGGVKESSSLKSTTMINAKAGGVNKSSSLKSTAIINAKGGGVKESSSLKSTAIINAKAGGVKESSSLKSTAMINAKAGGMKESSSLKSTAKINTKAAGVKKSSNLKSKAKSKTKAVKAKPQDQFKSGSLKSNLTAGLKVAPRRAG